MKTLTVEKIIIYSILIIALLFSFQLLSDYTQYTSAMEEIKNGNYEAAAYAFEKLNDYRDAEILKEYCDIMSEYDSGDFISVYRSYRGLNVIKEELDNKQLAEEFTKTTTEVETLYKHYNIALSAK